MLDGDNYRRVSNAVVEVTVENDSWNPAHLRYKTVNVISDSNGYFTATITVSPAVGTCRYYSGISTHVYDKARIYAKSGNKENEYILYVFAHPIV